MEDYIFTYSDGILYRNGIKMDECIKENKISKIKYDYNAWNVYCEHCKHPIDITDEYCAKCGYKLEFNEKENQKFIDEYDKQVTHPCGLPLTKEEIVNAVGKPVYVFRKKYEKVWKIVHKIEINENGYNINFTDGGWFLFDDILIYDPTNIVRNNLYPYIKNNEEGQISLNSKKRKS